LSPPPDGCLKTCLKFEDGRNQGSLGSSRRKAVASAKSSGWARTAPVPARGQDGALRALPAAIPGSSGRRCSSSSAVGPRRGGRGVNRPGFGGGSKPFLCPNRLVPTVISIDRGCDGWSPSTYPSTESRLPPSARLEPLDIPLDGEPAPSLGPVGADRATEPHRHDFSSASIRCPVTCRYRIGPARCRARRRGMWAWERRSGDLGWAEDSSHRGRWQYDHAPRGAGPPPSPAGPPWR